MSYFARVLPRGLARVRSGFAGHGRTPGHFLCARGHAVKRCSRIACARENPRRPTILAGIRWAAPLLRIAARVPVAGLIAVSPAPMRAAHGSRRKNCFSAILQIYPRFFGARGLARVWVNRSNASDLVTSRSEKTTKYLEIPGRRMSSVLFSGRQFRLPGIGRNTYYACRPSANSRRTGSLSGRWRGPLGSCCLQGHFSGRSWKKRERRGETERRGSKPGGLFLEFGVRLLALMCFCCNLDSLKATLLFQGDYLASMVLLLGALRDGRCSPSIIHHVMLQAAAPCWRGSRPERSVAFRESELQQKHNECRASSKF